MLRTQLYEKIGKRSVDCDQQHACMLNILSLNMKWSL